MCMQYQTNYGAKKIYSIYIVKKEKKISRDYCKFFRYKSRRNKLKKIPKPTDEFTQITRANFTTTALYALNSVILANWIHSIWFLHFIRSTFSSILRCHQNESIEFICIHTFTVFFSPFNFWLLCFTIYNPNRCALVCTRTHKTLDDFRIVKFSHTSQSYCNVCTANGDIFGIAHFYLLQLNRPGNRHF